MNTIKQLIEKYCLEGVEYKKLIDVANVLYGFPFVSKLFTDDSSFIPLIRIRDVLSGKASTYYEGQYDVQYIIKRGDILIGMDGNFNLSKWNDRDGILNQRVVKINSKDDNIVLNGFLFHLLGPVFKDIEKTITGSTVKHLSAKSINSISIPIPPISVQREIVRILDNFTSLEAELEAELEARRKQYEYYRDQLLSFKHLSGGGKNEVEWKTLGEVAEIVGGRDYKQFNHGNIPVYGSGGIMTYIDTYAYDRPTVLLPRKGSISNVFYTDMPFWNVDTIFYTIIHNELLPKFFYYYMCNYHIERLNTSNAARPALTRTVLNNIPIPVPPLSEQRRIVSILDRFESLVNDITTGLPAEIAARHQQYEYYRDQLLSFKRK
jgi:type I restriction enzyme S subunit